MGVWDTSLTLGSLIPGLSNTLKDAKQLVRDANMLEKNAKTALQSSINNAINTLDTAISQATYLIDNITDNLDSSGVSRLDLGVSDGGYNALINEISNASNKPLTPLNGFYAGSLLLVTAPDFTQAITLKNKLLSIFTIQ